MRLSLIIDGIFHQCDSTDPDLLGKWIMEIFGRIQQITPATLIEFRAEPSWVPQGKDLPWGPDWLADSRVLGQVRPIRSPRDLVAELGKQLDEYERLPR